MGTAAPRPLVVATIQATPLPLDREATIERACELIMDASDAGARLVVFPATYSPGYPDWVWTIPANDTQRHRDLRATLLANSVEVPGDCIDRLCSIARRARINVAIGISERAANGAALYNTILHINERGDILARHRAITLASAEQLVWTPGDGETFGAVRYPFGLVGGLIGREHYLPLARHALYAWGIRLYLAFGQESGDPWLATLRHIAREGQVAVLNSNAIFAPDGRLLTNPAHQSSPFLTATLDTTWLLGNPESPAHIGADARADIFRLTIRRASPQPPLAIPTPSSSLPSESENSAPQQLPL
ncbi:MAG: nitrilase-related carbon-nitrogen hydrolase [Thermomicrobiales bacterium]